MREDKAWPFKHPPEVRPVMHDWFRSPDWSSEAQQDFEQRLRRARAYNRPQFLRIKGLALADAGEAEGARELWLRVLESTDKLAGLQQSGPIAGPP